MITTLSRSRRFRLAHLSDLHLQSDTSTLSLTDIGLHRALPRIELEQLGRGRRFDGALPRLERVAEELDALAPDAVLVTGDLTALALEDEFHSAHDVLAAFDAPRREVIVVPGNHDRYAPEGPASRLFEEHMGHLLHSALPAYADPLGYPFVRFVGGELAVVGLDSTRVPAYAGYVFGRLGDDQLARLDALLADPALAHRSVVTMVHHAPLDAAGKRNPFSGGLVDGARLLEVLADRCAALLCGHVHSRYRVRGQTPELFCAGSVTERGEEGYWIIDVEEGRVMSAEEILPDGGAADAERRVA
jgi:3',5'-cyclic AMP phosphodiesterase CpdA